jgi:hypothetical protein
MLSRRKSLAALAAVTAALAVTVPAASASAATTAAPTVDPTVCQLFNITTGALGPIGPMQVPGVASLTNVLGNAGASVGCAPAAPPAGLRSLPSAVPW